MSDVSEERNEVVRQMAQAAVEHLADDVARRREAIMATLASGFMRPGDDGYKLTEDDMRDLREMADAIMRAAR